MAYQWPIRGPNTNASTTNRLGRTINSSVLVPNTASKIETTKIAPHRRERKRVPSKEGPRGPVIRRIHPLRVLCCERLSAYLSIQDRNQQQAINHHSEMLDEENVSEAEVADCNEHD